jgi:Xaa-Pro aminopeptidase
MTTPLCTLDLARMRKDRMEKLRDAMVASGIDVLVLCLQSNVSYATGARVPTADHVRAAWWRAVAVVHRDDPWPHLFTEFPEGSSVELPNDHLHPAVEVEAAAGAAELVEQLPDGRLGLDDAPFALWQALQFRDVVDASLALAPAKLTKTLDELECIRQAQAINERAMRTVREMVAAGVPATTLSGTFLREIAELGASANVVDPVFNVMPTSVAAGPYSVTGDPVFPLPTQPRVLEPGDVLWIDTGINLNGYSSDFGATWIVGGEPDAHARSQFARWRDTVDRVLEVTKPGATGADLVRAGTERDGSRPWLSYFYLAHGTGTDPAEMPLIGTDRGDEFDASIVLAPGMVLVLEPVVWDDGHCGHRSEEIIAITDDGYTWLSSRAELNGVGI